MPIRSRPDARVDRPSFGAVCDGGSRLRADDPARVRSMRIWPESALGIVPGSLSCLVLAQVVS